MIGIVDNSGGESNISQEKLDKILQFQDFLLQQITKLQLSLKMLTKIADNSRPIQNILVEGCTLIIKPVNSKQELMKLEEDLKNE